MVQLAFAQAVREQLRFVVRRGDHDRPVLGRRTRLHLWVLVPETLVPLRDDGLVLLGESVERSRVPVHWGMCLATYPFFRDVAATIGRLLSLQGRAALSQIVRRMTESWGARSTVTRAVQRVVRSFVAWGVVVETSERGIFAPAPKIGVHDAAVGAWLLEAGIADTDRQEYPLHSLVGSVLLYPFDLRLSARDVTRRPRLEIHHQGLDGAVVTWRATG